VLFDLGRAWTSRGCARDWTLAATGVAESALTFGAVFWTLVRARLSRGEGGLAAAIAIATSPAVVLLVSQDLRSEGQVTARALNLVALNSLIASILTTILLASAHYECASTRHRGAAPALPLRGLARARCRHVEVTRVLAACSKRPRTALHAHRGMVVAAVASRHCSSSR
jgi:hypothetical protein